MELSVCIITKNEWTKLQRCLEGLAELPVEILVMDTGSDDGTVTHLQELEGTYGRATLRFREIPWKDDFAWARNTAAAAATYDNIFVLDTDEWIAPDGANLQEALELVVQRLRESQSPLVGEVLRHNLYNRKGQDFENIEFITRMYNRRYCHYTGRIHEQLVAKEAGTGCTYFRTTVEILHDGYDGEERAVLEKAKRNISLLLQELEERPEDPYVYYQLGKSYYMAGDYKTSAQYFDQGLYFDVDPKLTYVQDLVETYGYALVNCNQAQKALGLSSVQEEFPSPDFAFMLGIVYMNNALFPEAIACFEKAKKGREVKMVGVNSYLADYNIGVIYEVLGDLESAKTYYKKCGSYTKAMERLREIEG